MSSETDPDVCQPLPSPVEGASEEDELEIQTCEPKIQHKPASLEKFNIDHVDDDTTKPDESPGPDGGFGWVVTAAAFISLVTLGFVAHAFSVLYVSLVDHFQAKRGVIGWIGSLYWATNISGVLIGALTVRYGERRMGLCGGLLATIGICLSSLLLNIPFMYLTYGFCGGVGQCMSAISAVVIVQRYFNKRRALAVGIASSGGSIGGITSSYAVDMLLQKYGLSGTLLVMGGVSMQALVSSSLYRPPPSVKKEKTTQKSVLKDLKDVTVLKNPKLILFLVGMFFSIFGNVGFVMHYISRLLFIGVERDVAVMLQTVCVFGLALGRVVFSFVANVKRLDVVVLYTVLSVICAGLTVTFGLADNALMAGIWGAVVNFIQGGCYTLMPTVLIAITDTKSIAKVLGYFHTVVALGILLAIPLAGFVFDLTQNYDTPYVVIGCLDFLGIGFHIILVVLHVRATC